MPSTINADNGVSSGSAGLKSTADSSGVLALQTNGTTAVSISTAQVVSYTNPPIVTGGTANGVAYLNGSKVLTTGSALTYNGTGLGIGVASASNPLHIDFDGTATRIVRGSAIGFIYNTGTSATDIFRVQSNGGSVQLYTTGGTATLDTSGNLGLNNTSPTTLITSIGGAGGKGMVLSGQVPVPYFEDTNGTDGCIFVDDGNIGFVNGTTERARIDTSGNLLVGTTSKLAGGIVGLDINTSAATGITFAKSGTNKAYFYLLTDASAFQWQTASGTAASVVSSTNGVTLSNGATSWASLSDERKKDIIEPITDAATKVSSLRAVIGKYKTEEDGIRRAMLIAQDVQAVLPEAVVENKDGELLLQYTEIIPLLVAAIKEQSAIITQLQADVAALKGASA